MNYYETIIFDCDGVILNSNSIKSKAFYDVALPYGKKYAELLVKFNISNGGISRQEKFEYFITKILKKKLTTNLFNELINKYTKIVSKNLTSVEVTPSLENIRSKTSKSNWMIVSGGNQNEISNVLKNKNIEQYFNAGIFGNPMSKMDIVKKKLNNNEIRYPVIFFGDSIYDYKVAKEFNFDFIFVSDWTDLINWNEFISKYNIKHVKKIYNYFD